MNDKKDFEAALKGKKGAFTGFRPEVAQTFCHSW